MKFHYVIYDLCEGRQEITVEADSETEADGLVVIAAAELGCSNLVDMINMTV